ncbi:MAG: transcription antitermination factor NusB [Myxococcota bacterium]
MSRSGHATRRRSRQLALQTLYAGDLAERATSESAPPIDEVFERVAENFDLPEGARSFAAELAQGTVANLARIDELLAQNATNWKLSRMAAVDRNILRLAVYELTNTATPVSIVLDEAIVLASRFGADSSPRFVNGVLDAVARQIHLRRDCENALEESS